LDGANDGPNHKHGGHEIFFTLQASELYLLLGAYERKLSSRQAMPCSEGPDIESILSAGDMYGVVLRLWRSIRKASPKAFDATRGCIVA
jgi:hypothetical protein